LERLPGVKRADVRLETEEARVVYDDRRQTPEKLAAAIDRLGFQASILTVTAAPRPTLLVDGVTDLKAVRKIEETLRALKGVGAVRVDPGTGEVFVEYDGQAVSPERLFSALQAAGFSARPAPAR
jgi:copper chaperone CopZ